MVRTPFTDKCGMKKGTWTPEEDKKLTDYVTRYGSWNWRQLPRFAGLARCGKSCRLRWLNYLRPDIKRGNFTEQEEEIIIKLHQMLGSRWCKIAANLPGRTDNDIKNHWHSSLKKRFQRKKHNDDENINKATKPAATDSSSNENMVTGEEEEEESDYSVNKDDIWSESFLDELMPGNGDVIFGGSDTARRVPDDRSLSLSPHSWNSDDDVEPTLVLPVVENSWIESCVTGIPHVPNELFAPFMDQSYEYFCPGYHLDLWNDVDLWNQSDFHDNHIEIGLF